MQRKGAMNNDREIPNIPKTDKERVVIVGAGFGGLKVARQLIKRNKFQVVLLDKNNYHQFQPLFYQVATAGLEPSSISFPLRKIFQNKNHVHFRIAEILEIDSEKHCVKTNIGVLSYDHLILSTGVNTNYFGNDNISNNAIPMKSVSEAVFIRNKVIRNYERALEERDENTVKALMNVVVVGGGPTGVELSGALAEMRRWILPKDYPELDFDKMKVYLLEAGPRLLNGMSEHAGEKSLNYLRSLGVDVRLNTMVKDYDGLNVSLAGGDTLCTYTLIWAAGVTGSKIEGIGEMNYKQNNRIEVNRVNQIPDIPDVYVIGDAAYMETDKFPEGHPQVAQVAIQQGTLLGKNLVRQAEGKKLKEFEYLDKGSLATVGRKLAVADLPFFRFSGYWAWILWLFVHLMAIVGVKNRLFIFLNWSWSYIFYDQSLRLLIIHKRLRLNQN
jgi:NADH dehydrogenase